KGYEETAAVILTRKLLKARTSQMPSVKSIFGCVSCPGWVFVESTNHHLNVNLLCQDVRDVYGHQIFPVPSDSVADYLQELPLFVPEIGTFVHLNAPSLYHGNLAYVVACNDRTPMLFEDKAHAGKGLDVIVVPRITLFKDTSRCRRGVQPPQALFHYRTARLILGDAKIKDWNEETDTFVLQNGHLYPRGLRFITTHKFKFGTPTVDKLCFWDLHTDIPKVHIQSAYQQVESLCISVNDCVIVISGSSKGTVGTVVDTSQNNEATIWVNNKPVKIVVSTSQLRKNFEVGDRVCIAGGADDSRVGWVIAIQPEELLLFNQTMSEYVCYMSFKK
ncbi:hypothetical protein C0991_007070, partial [Blastosporella zonata]